MQMMTVAEILEATDGVLVSGDAKKQINDVMCTVKDICDKHFSDCIECPLYKHIWVKNCTKTRS